MNSIGGHADEAQLITVIIPVFNGEAFLAEALESVFGQDYRPLEVIVVDDGSTDTSADVARSFPSVIVVQQSNTGLSGARNAGIQRARGSFLSFLDADDLMAPRRLSKQMDHLSAHPEAGCV